MASNLLSLRRERALLVAPLLLVALGAPGCAVVGSTVKVAGQAVEKTIDAAAGGPANSLQPR